MIFHYIKNFYDFFIGFSIGILLNDFFDRRCPDEYKIFTNQMTNLFVNVSFNCIYYYSKCQIFFSKYIKTSAIYIKIMNAIKSITNNTKNDLDLLFVKNNFHYNFPIDFPNFVITSDTSKTPSPKRITYGEGDYKNVSFEESDIKFMLVEFKFDGNLHKIDLKTDMHNYYMVGNQFTKEFFIFYMNEYLLKKNKQHVTLDYLKYSVKIIDDDVNTININFTDKNECIVLEKKGYKVINN